jgi:poly(A) polymerase
MQVFGVSPGPAVGVIKNAIKDAILDGDIPNDREAAFAFMIRRAGAMGLEPLKRNEK